MKPPTVFVVGAGPVATAMAGALRRGGVEVLGLWARRRERAETAAAAAAVPAFADAWPPVMSEAEVIVVAVRDDAIGEVARQLVDSGRVTRRQVLVHCSGAKSGQEAFAAVAARVGGVGVAHPLRAVADAQRAMAALPDTVFGVQGDAVGGPVARALVDAIGGRALELDAAGMAAYHAAAAIASNYTVALFDAAAEVLGAAGIGRAQAVEALVPLVEGTLANLRARGLPTALTGPIRRGDRATVQRHLGALAALAPELAATYRQLGRRTVALARECGDADARDLDEIAALLAEP